MIKKNNYSIEQYQKREKEFFRYLELKKKYEPTKTKNPVDTQVHK